MSGYDKYEIVGESWSPDPRERRLRFMAQMMDKPLYLLLALLALAAVERLGDWIPGYEPSIWFALGIWLAALVALRLIVIRAVRAFRAAFDIPAPRREGVGREPTQE